MEQSSEDGRTLAAEWRDVLRRAEGLGPQQRFRVASVSYRRSTCMYLYETACTCIGIYISRRQADMVDSLECDCSHLVRHVHAIYKQNTATMLSYLSYRVCNPHRTGLPVFGLRIYVLFTLRRQLCFLSTLPICVLAGGHISALPT